MQPEQRWVVRRQVNRKFRDMCGFSGIIVADHSHTSASEWKSRFQTAAQKISHRGSDDNRLIQFRSLFLNHFRLAFQDLEAGRQPMLSADGTFAITFNGEVYNHFELRKTLDKKHNSIHWKTLSDTETILQGWLLEGDQFFDLLDGEFAFVITKTDGSEWIARRDFFGVKPLFFQFANVNTRQFSIAQKSYSTRSSLVSFSSEIKALPGRKIWNRDGALRQFVGLFEPICSPFEEIIQCPPGGTIKGRRSPDAGCTQFDVQVIPRNAVVRTGQSRPFWGEPSLLDTLSQFREHLSQSVSDRLLSDVELGVYLSGGIDSKAVAFELSRIQKRRNISWEKGRLKSFTVGFETSGYDESQEAVSFAQHLGFLPHVLPLSETALNYSYPHAVYISENIQPYTNGAAKWWLSLFARQHVPGVLTGDGADEVLCGYPSFRYCSWWKFAQRNRTGNTTLGMNWRDEIYVKKFFAQTQNPWLAGSSAAGTGVDFTESVAQWGILHPLYTQIKTIAECILGASEANIWLSAQAESVKSWFFHGYTDDQLKLNSAAGMANSTLLLWQNYFCNTHLPVQVLNWVGDRMEMANTLEGRTPFLSRRLREFIRHLPDVALIQGFTDKAILRKAYATEFDRGFALTPKKQFNAPFIQFKSLFEQFDAQNVLQKMNISNQPRQKANQLMKVGNVNATSLKDVNERYRHTHQLSALQTLVCASIVHRGLVEEVTPVRDQNFEESITAKGVIGL